MRLLGWLGVIALGLAAGVVDACLLRYLARRLLAMLAEPGRSGCLTAALFMGLNLGRWALVLAPAVALAWWGGLWRAAAFLLACGLSVVVTAILCGRHSSDSVR